MHLSELLLGLVRQMIPSTSSPAWRGWFVETVGGLGALAQLNSLNLMKTYLNGCKEGATGSKKQCRDQPLIETYRWCVWYVKI